MLSSVKTVLLSSLALFSANAAAVPLQACYEDKNAFPYIVGNSEAILAQPGVIPEFIQALERKIPELKVSMARMPWKRCLNSLQNGKTDVVVASYSQERAGYAAYPMLNGQVDSSLRFDTRTYAIYKMRASPLLWDGQKFTQLYGAIGTPLGYSIVDDLKKMGIAAEESPSASNDFQKMQLGRVAAVIAQEKVGDLLLRQERFGDIIKLTPAFTKKDYYVVLSKQFAAQHAELAKKIWQAVAELREQEMDEMLLKYVNMGN
ncbi:substrate-binding periplasmic protein [Undibacterium sp. Di27W]|uniref:substrate-binding periplasmic protein n=1 Tax=Undibacterium sp. Di27W TaxID=3413036 RepID=UPI003BEFF2B6